MTGAFQSWGLEFVVRYHYGGDADRSGEVAAAFGPALLIAAVAGVVVGSVLGDRAEKRRPGQGRMSVVGLGPLIGAPFVLLGLWGDSLAVLYICLPVGTFFNSFYAGPVLAALHDMVDPHVRAAATGAYFFAVHLLGDAISPGIVGYVSKYTDSLRVGLSIAALVAVLGALAALSNVRRSGRHHAARSSLGLPVQRD
jgi:MFS family permease